LRTLKKLLKRKSEYWLPPQFEPRSIPDLGANIGITSIDFALRYPQSSITAVEPVAANFQLFQENISSFQSIRALKVAVGKHEERAALRGAGQSFQILPVSASTKAAGREEITVRDLNALLEELGITQIDFFKIDLEGAEYDVLTSLNSDLLRRVKWIVGELHGLRDFALLDYLSTSSEIVLTISGPTIGLGHVLVGNCGWPGLLATRASRDAIDASRLRAQVAIRLLDGVRSRERKSHRGAGEIRPV